MKKINWKLRFSNPMFIGQLVLSIVLPILSYVGLTVQDLTTWAKLFEVIVQAIPNPYCLLLVVVSVYNTIVDPTTKGLSDSEHALNKTEL